MQQFTHGKGQELKATDKLLDRLCDIDGTVVTADALHAVRAEMEKIRVGKKAHFLIQVKNNTPALAAAIRRALDRNGDDRFSAEEPDFGHGRIEDRSLTMVPISPVDTGWPHTHVACFVERDRELLRAGETVDASSEQSLYVGSFSVHAFTPERVAQMIRRHWGIENELHHPKDRSMDEDRCRASEAGIGRTMSCLRGLVSQVSRRTSESLGVIRQRFAGKPHLLFKLLTSTSLADWEKRCKPYKPAAA